MGRENNLIREKNLKQLIHYLFTNKCALKSEIAKDTGISVVTINSLVKQLLIENIIFEGDMIQPALGRPAVQYQYNREHFLLVSIQEIKDGSEKKTLDSKQYC